MAANESVVDYIKQASAQGHSLEQIRKALSAAGWSEQDISDSIRQSSSVAPAPAVQQPVQPALSEQEILDRQKFGFFDPILKPKQVFSVEKNRATFNKAAKNYAVVGAIYGLLIAIALFFISSIIRTIAVGFGASGLGAITGVTSIALALAGFVAGIILMVVSGVVGAAFVWACCKLLGGKASFNQIFYLQSVYLLPYIIVLIAAAIIGVIPIIGWLIALIAVLYNLYLLYLVIKEANEFSRGKAIAAIVLMVVIMIVLSIIFSAVTASILPKISPPDVIRT